MRIGVDIRNLTHEISGTSRYIYEILRELLKKKKNKIYLFSPSPIKVTYKKNLKTKNLYESFFYLPLLRYIWGKYYLKRELEKFNIDIFWGAAHRIPADLPKNIIKIVTIFDTVFLDSPHLMSKFNYLKEYLTTPQSILTADYILVPSESTKKSLIKHFGSNLKNKIKVIYLGGNLSTNKISKQEYHESNYLKPYLLFVGSISPRKNLKNFLWSFSLMNKNLQNRYNIIIVGNFNFEQIDIISFTKKIGLENTVRFKGSINDSELKLFYQNAEYLIFPSLNEGFGLPIIEAQSFGIPVITSNIYSMPEIMGRGGYLLNPYSVNSMKKKLTKVLLNKNNKNIKKMYALKNSKKYNWKTTSNEILRLFEGLYYK